jgi:ribosome-associated translation inhibitor RaiA
MQIKVHYQGFEGSPWMEEFITEKVEKLKTYLSPASTILANIELSKGVYKTNITIHNHHDYSFTAKGENLFESFTSAKSMALRALKENKRKVKDKINRKYHSLRNLAA